MSFRKTDKFIVRRLGGWFYSHLSSFEKPFSQFTSPDSTTVSYKSPWTRLSEGVPYKWLCDGRTNCDERSNGRERSHRSSYRRSHFSKLVCQITALEEVCNHL